MAGFEVKKRCRCCEVPRVDHIAYICIYVIYGSLYLHIYI